MQFQGNSTPVQRCHCTLRKAQKGMWWNCAKSLTTGESRIIIIFYLHYFISASSLEKTHDLLSPLFPILSALTCFHCANEAIICNHLSLFYRWHPSVYICQTRPMFTTHIHNSYSCYIFRLITSTPRALLKRKQWQINYGVHASTPIITVH